MCRQIILLTSLMLISGLSATRAQESYITVHAINPEGVEIASIEGMDQYCVEIFDGEDFVDYALYDDETNSVPIPISPGTHTIKVAFNGIIKELNINIKPNTTKALTFVFERTEFDVINWIDTELAAQSTSSVFGTHMIPGIDDYLMDIEYEYFPNEAEPAVYTYVSAKHRPENDFWDYNEPFNDMTYYALATFAFDGKSFKCGTKCAVLVDGNAPAFVDVHVRINTFYQSSGSFPRNIMDFDNWIIQSVRNDYPDISLSTEESQSKYKLFGPAGFDGFADYQTNMIPAKENWQSAGVFSSLLDNCQVDDVFNLSHISSQSSEGNLEIAKMSSVPYDILGTGIHWQEPPECADPVWVNEADEMVLPYDKVELAFEFWNEGDTDMYDVDVTFERNPDSLYGAAINFESPSYLIDYIPAHKSKEVKRTIVIAGLDDSDTPNKDIWEKVVKQKQTLLLENAIKVCISGGTESFILSPRKTENEGGKILSIQYPRFIDTWDSCPVGDVDNFYLQGDYDFHHPNDVLVRKYAVEASVWPEQIFPDEVAHVVINIANYINDIVADKEDPGILDIDIGIAAKLDNGSIKPRPNGEKDEAHVCFGQAYLFGSLARTIGVPSRELNLALGKSIHQLGPFVFRIKYQQEAAIQVWCDGYWQLYDTYLWIDNWDHYLEKVNLGDKPCIKYRAWYSYDRRIDPILPWRGHHFGINNDGESDTNRGWKHLKDDHNERVIIVIESPVHTYLRDAEGRITGHMNGSIIEDIPDSYYIAAGSRFYTNAVDSTAFWEADETICVPSSSPSEDYSIVMTGTDNGHYDLILAYIHEDGTIDGSTISFNIWKDEMHTYDISVNAGGEISITGLPAFVDIDPDTLNLKSKGKWITCYIELPEGFEVSLIDGGTVNLEGISAYIGNQGWANAEANKENIVDHDKDGIYERMVKFDSSLLKPLLVTGDATLTVYGELTDGTVFEGADSIRVINPRAK